MRIHYVFPISCTLEDTMAFHDKRDYLSILINACDDGQMARAQDLVREYPNQFRLEQKANCEYWLITPFRCNPFDNDLVIQLKAWIEEAIGLPPVISAHLQNVMQAEKQFATREQKKEVSEFSYPRSQEVSAFSYPF